MKVTVYIPTYNRPYLLLRALESVLKQTYSDLEIIVVNDGESLPADIHKFFKDNSIIYLETTGNERACVARNKAINAATGSYITGLDDDDMFEPTRISDFVEFQKNNGDGIYFSGYKYVEGEKVKTRISENKVLLLNDILKGNLINNQVFAPLSYFLSVGMFDEIMPAWQDYDLWVRLIERYGSAKLVENYTYIMDGSENIRISKNKENILKAVDFFYQKHPAYSNDDYLRACLYYNKQIYFSIKIDIKESILMFRYLPKIKIFRLLIEKLIYKLTGFKG
jgi:glycosyltransferase involved in cell wall biosynthesis